MDNNEYLNKQSRYNSQNAYESFRRSIDASRRVSEIVSGQAIKPATPVTILGKYLAKMTKN